MGTLTKLPYSPCRAFYELPVKGYGAVVIQHYMLYLYDLPSGYVYPYHAFSLSVYSRKEFAGELLFGQLKDFSC